MPDQRYIEYQGSVNDGSSALLMGMIRDIGEIRTASTPAWLPLCELDPPSRVWRLNVVDDFKSVRNFFKNDWNTGSAILSLQEGQL